MNLGNFIHNNTTYKTQIVFGIVFSFLSIGFFMNGVNKLKYPQTYDGTMLYYAYMLLCVYISSQASNGLQQGDKTLLQNWYKLKVSEAVYSVIISVCIQIYTNYNLDLSIMSAIMAVVAGGQLYMMKQNINGNFNQNIQEHCPEGLILK